MAQLRETLRIAEQSEKQLFGAGRLERVDAQLRVMRPAAPAVAILRAVVDEQQDAAGGHALHQAVEQRLGLAVDPVQILEDQGERLPLAFAHEQRLEAVQSAPAPLRRIERLPGGVLDRQIEQGEHRRQNRPEVFVQEQDLAQHFLGARPQVVARRDAEIGLEQIDHRRPGTRAARGDRRAFDDQPGAHPGAVGELVEQP